MVAFKMKKKKTQIKRLFEDWVMKIVNVHLTIRKKTEKGWKKDMW